MRTNLLAMAGAAGLLIGSALLIPGSASAQTPTPTASAPHTDFIAMLDPVPTNKVKGSGEAWLTLTGNSAKFTIQVSGLINAPHGMHIYVGGAGQCPTAGDAAVHKGHQSLTIANGAPAFGTVRTSLTTSGDTSAASALAMTRFTDVGNFTYSRTFTVDPSVVSAVKGGTAVFVVHGIDYNGNGKYDAGLGMSESNPSVPAEATDPALCGGFVASQMVSVPTGSADTGGGSTSAFSSPAEVTLGATALAAALIAGFVAYRRRSAVQSTEVVVTNGFRRMIR